MNPIINLLYNTKLKRWHPIIFIYNPLPGVPSTPVRYKSKGHHTVGFETREEAVNYCYHDLAPKLEHAESCFENDIEWDGEDIPALVIFK